MFDGMARILKQHASWSSTLSGAPVHGGPEGTECATSASMDRALVHEKSRGFARSMHRLNPFPRHLPRLRRAPRQPRSAAPSFPPPAPPQFHPLPAAAFLAPPSQQPHLLLRRPPFSSASKLLASPKAPVQWHLNHSPPLCSSSPPASIAFASMHRRFPTSALPSHGRRFLLPQPRRIRSSERCRLPSSPPVPIPATTAIQPPSTATIFPTSGDSPGTVHNTSHLIFIVTGHHCTAVHLPPLHSHHPLHLHLHATVLLPFRSSQHPPSHPPGSTASQHHLRPPLAPPSNHLLLISPFFCHVLGIIPKTLMPKAVTGEPVGEVRTVSDMHKREAEMAHEAMFPLLCLVGLVHSMNCSRSLHGICLGFTRNQLVF